VGIQDFAREYGTKTDEELLRLALEPDELTDEARFALSAELRTRGIDTPTRLAALRNEEESRKDEQAKNIGRMGLLHPYGIGRSRFGKADYRFDSQSGLEEFVTTVFVVLLWFPLIPTGTYRIQRKRAFFSGQMTVLEKLPLDWEQVLKVWVIAAGSLLLLVWAFKLLPRIVFR
jgi:hypothetical protein